MFGHCTDTYVHVHNYTSFLIKPDQPCDASESQLHAGAAPSEQQPSWHQSFQLTDHPGVMFIYLYSTACLYNKSSDRDGVNRFCCSSSIFGRKPPSKASLCDMLPPLVVTGTGSLLSNECSLSKPASSWLSKPFRNLLMASSVSAASGLA